MLGGLVGNENLVSLNVSNNELTHAIVTQLVQFVESSQLQELRIANNKLGSKGVEELVSVFKNDSTRIATLDLSFTDMNSAAAARLFASLKGYPSLLNLSVEGNQL